MKEMNDLIRRKDAMEAMRILEAEDNEMYGCSIPECFDSERAIEALEKLPSAEPERKANVENGEDALHYLKMLRDMTCGTSQILRNTSQITCPKCHSEFVILPDTNTPLTWDELKRMTGRPVWVEEYWAPMEDEAGVTEDEGDTVAYWAILTYADEKRISVVNGRVDQFLHKDIWNNHEVSHSWQAYRKER